MRIAFATNPALGHVLPLLPLALAARRAGHDVAVLAGSSLAPIVERFGLRHVAAGPADLPTAFALVPERQGLAGRRLAAVTWARVFGGAIGPELAKGLLDLARDWRPDLLVHEDSEQGTWIAAERLGIPHVSLQATAWRGAGIRLSAEPLNALRKTLGLVEDADLQRWHRHGYLTTRPKALWNPDDPMPGTTAPIRPIALDEVDDPVPEWLTRQDARRPRVAVTLGTILPGRLDTMASILDGLARLDLDVVATVGPGLEPRALGARPPGIRVERYVPMSRLLETCDALVFHAGSGTMLAALAEGLPLVLMPVAADQPENADRCAAAGVGVVLEPAACSPEAVAEATTRILADPGFRNAARRARHEISTMPSPASVVPQLEALAAAGPDGILAAPS
jgi:UDP:flavonoid glycosyltransferase YjiC (YdhE family)